MLFRRLIVCGWLSASLVLIGSQSSLVAESSKTRLGYWHFQGAEQIRDLDGGQVFKSIMESDSTGPVKDLVMSKLASAPDKLLYGLAATAPESRRDLLTPLLEDLLESESYGEVHGISPTVINLTFGVRLPEERRIDWNTKLRQFAGSYGWDINPPLSEGMTPEWEANSSDAGFLIRFAQVEDWTLLSVGSDVLTQLLQWAPSVESGEFPPVQPEKYWWTLNLGLKTLRALSSKESNENGLDGVTVSVSGDGDFLRTQGGFHLAESLDSEVEEWSIPVDHILEPIMSFSAHRNLTPLVTQLPGVKHLFPRGAPNQSIAWSRGAKMQGTRPGVQAAPVFLNFISWPVAEENWSVQGIREDVANWLEGNLLKSPRATLRDGVEPNSFNLTMVPAFILPFVQGIKHEGKAYHLAGLTHRLVNRTNPPPPSLFAQIEKHPRLRYYHWEITGEKIYQYRNFMNLIGFMFDKGQLLKDSPLFGWTEELEGKLGNSVTQILTRSPKELELQRKSQFGLTGFEIALLTKWMHSEAFPWIDVEELFKWEFSVAQVPGQNNRPR